MKITIAPATDELAADWDRLVETSSHGTAFHLWEWLKLMEKHSWISILGKRIQPKLHPLAIYKTDTLVGVFPLYHFSRRPISMVASPPSRSGAYYLGPVMADYDSLKQGKREYIHHELMKHVDDYIFTTLKAKYATLSSPPGLADARPFSWTGYRITPMYDYVLDLTQPIDTIWDNFKRDLRKQINIAEKKQYTVLDGDEQDLVYIYRSYFRRVEERGILFRMDEKFLREAHQAFAPRNLRVFLLKEKDQRLGGLIATCIGKTFAPWIGSHKSKSSTVISNDYMHWELIKWAKENGFERFQMTWANNPRLCRFKSKYTPQLAPYFLARKYASPIYAAAAEAIMHVKNPQHGKVPE